MVAGYFPVLPKQIRKLTLQEAIDYLEELVSDDEDNANEAKAIFIQPPDYDGYLSGEDDAEEDTAGIPDDICAEQLKADCEIVLHSGKRLNSWNDEEQCSPTDIHNMPIFFADDDLVLRSLSSPTTSKLRKIEPKKWNVPLPEKNKSVMFSWLKEDMTTSLPCFPESNYADCRDLHPHEQFEKFFDAQLLQHIADHSNKYAVLCQKPNPNITPDEIRVVIGIMIISGYSFHTGMRYFWNQDDDVRNVLISNSMRRNRFEQIVQALHFEDSDKGGTRDIPNPDKLRKLRPITDHIKANMMKNFHAEQNLSYDESMISYFGRHGMKQFIKGKPVRCGYKVWSVCTPSGYLVNFEIYQGKNPRSNNAYEEKFGKCAAPLIDMIEDFDDEKRCLRYNFFFDNLFTSIPLLTFLKACGYNATGTIRENRVPVNCPISSKKELMKKPRGHCEYMLIEPSSLLLLKWVDNSVVSVLSTCFGVEPKSMASRYSKLERKKVKVPRPCAITEYNKYMCGVDRFDQNIGLYRISFRGKKWYSSIFTWLIDACIVNAWQLHCKGQTKISQLDFRREIAKYYCMTYGEKGKGPGAPVVARRLEDKTKVENILRYDGKNHFVRECQRRRCAHEKCTSTIRTECAKCNVGLCIKCFIQFHTKM